MSKYKKETVETYNRSAKELAEYFRGIGSRVNDIERALNLLGSEKDNPDVLEIGCGDGRDAKEIVMRSNNYTGFDISKELIKLARQHVPGAKFEIADAVSYRYPYGLDIVFAFASLLHLDKNEIKEVLDKIAASLNKGGIFYISLKHSDAYEGKIKKDKYGTRMFYFYNPEIIKVLAGDAYETVYLDSKVIGDTKWFEIALRKKDN